MTEAHLELLRDKYVLWDRAAREYPGISPDYHRLAADALKAALCELHAIDVLVLAAKGLLAVRPSNWNDGEDPEGEQVWCALDAALLTAKGQP